MKIRELLALFTAALLSLAPVVSSAQHSHSHGSSKGGMAMETREVLVDDLKVTFHIMANAEHRKMLKEMKMKEDIEAGTTHNISVTLTDPAGPKTFAEAAVTMKVVDPSGKDQIKPLRYEGSMKSFDAYFNLPQKGRYELLVLIRQGERRTTAGIYYDLK